MLDTFWPWAAARILVILYLLLSFCDFEQSQLLIYGKDIVDRRHGEPIEFLFLPKMGLFGQPGQ